MAFLKTFGSAFQTTTFDNTDSGPQARLRGCPRAELFKHKQSKIQIINSEK